MFYRAQEKRDELEEKQRAAAQQEHQRILQAFVAATMLIPALTILFMFWIHMRS